MVNVDEPEEPQGTSVYHQYMHTDSVFVGTEYHPDGYYFPRIIFFGTKLFDSSLIATISDSNGKPMHNIINVGGIPDKKYYHGTADSIINSMKDAISGGPSTQSTTTTTVATTTTTVTTAAIVKIPNALSRGMQLIRVISN